MKFYLAFVILAVVAAANANPAASFAQANSDKTLINYMLATDASSSTVDSALSAQCFSQYLPVLNEVATAFSVDYQQCITTANEATANLTAQAAASRVTFTNEISTICTAYNTCNNEADVVSFFNCYSTESANDVTTLYGLSSSATSAATTLTEGLDQIQQTETQCTNATEQTYVTDTAATYKMLDACLAGQSADTTVVMTTTEETPAVDVTTVATA